MSTALPNNKTSKRPNRPTKPEVTTTEGDEPKLNQRQKREQAGVNWVVVTWLFIVHGACIAAFFPAFFSWEGVALAVFFHWLSGSIGICIGYHRLLTHTGFKTYEPIRIMFALIGTLAGEGSAMEWVANHRKHHAHSDQDDDPHTPNHGGWWSHIYWLVYALKGPEVEPHVQKWAPDLAKDKGIRWASSMFLPFNFLVGIALAGAGYAYGGSQMATSFVLWGVFVRLVAILHTTWFVNSATHMWGYRNYETTDKSRNLWWVGLLAYGEGWHNNHHAYPRMAKHGHKWWEFDMSWMVIRAMKAVGLAWDVVDYRKKSETVG